MAIWSKSNCDLHKVTGSFSGVQALRLKATDALGYCYNAYTVAAGENYLFSCVYKTVSGDNANIVIYDVSNSAEIFNSGNLTSTSWKKFSSCFKTPSGCTSIQIRLYGVASGDICYFDSIGVIQQKISNGGFEASGAEIITNTDFEAGATGWAAWPGNTAVAQSAAQAHGGSNSLLITNDANQYGGYFTLSSSNLSANTYYRCSCWVYAPSGFSGGDIVLNFAALTDLSVIGGTVTTATQGSWVELSTTFKTGTDLDGYYRLQSVSIPSDGNNFFYIDDVSVKEVEGWSTSNATLELDDSEERSGTYCAKVTASSNNGSVYQTVSVTDNTWYTATFHSKQSASGHRVTLRVLGITTSTVYKDFTTIDEAGWIERSVTFKTNGDTSIRLVGYVESNTEIVYFDDWDCVPLCEKSATTETPSPEADHYKDGRW